MIDYLPIPGHTVPSWANDVLEHGSLVIDGLDEDLYHGTYALTSKSTLDVVNRSPAHYKYLIDGGKLESEEPPEEPEAFKVGRATHCLVLEPDSFEKRYFQLPTFGKMTSQKNRALRDAWLSENRQGRTYLTEAQMFAVTSMRESLLRIPKVRAALQDGSPEVTCVVKCPQTGLLRKIRVDWLCERESIGMDLKTAFDASPERWKWEAKRRRYPVQDAYYCDTAQLCDLDMHAMGFVVVEKSPPFVAGVYSVDDTARLVGERAYMHNLNTIATCVQTGHYPGYVTSPTGVQELVIPYSSAEVETHA